LDTRRYTPERLECRKSEWSSSIRRYANWTIGKEWLNYWHKYNQRGGHSVNTYQSMNSTQYTHISKTLSHALRHSPDAYDLTLDSQGWCSLSDLVFALNSRGLNVDESIIEKMIESSIKKRHEILNGKIRALYGHSVENKIVKNAAEPPEYLFHGTVQSRLGSIMEKGLLPMNRQYVHLSSDEKTAEIVGRRRKG